ncbi:pyrroline-5-carboxylate reductase [Pseudomonadales bacterium]|jgi:pyrroline-5-carboxylate reductase|nr:pyrroline-5-carboxylate reductase [Pseudomonadales bacterium]MDB9963088.1 pyrroline-5-carboxylate reductase [Pseudomonadales bacterium]MDC3327290.1 pyrroline-5-carboxylate reductase [Pseudomonadales bacterium]
MTQQLTFIGGGNIALAIYGGLLDAGYPPQSITVSDPSPEQGALATAMGLTWQADNASAIKTADIVLVCVKPNWVETVCQELQPALEGQTLVSVAAGVSTAQIAQWSGTDRVIRCMPNTPALVKTGMMGLFSNPSVHPDTCAAVENLLSSVGLTTWFDQESDLDAVTAISGSGPAYFFYLMEAMITAAESFGIEAAVARTLVVQTALGAASMAAGSEHSPNALRQQVTSPGGTTEAACSLLTEADFTALVTAACAAAKARSEALSAH